MQRIGDLVDGGFIELITTDLTIAEVVRKHAENEFKHLSEITRPHFRTLVNEYFKIELPAIDGETLKQNISKKYQGQVDKMFDGLNAKILKIDDVKPSAVFDTYDKGKDFFSGEGKKDQFPDAFIFERLKSETSAETPITIVSRDGDFKLPVVATKNFELVESIANLFGSLGLTFKSPDVNEFLDSKEAEFLQLVDTELKDWGLDANDVEDAYIEVDEVTNVEIENFVAFKSTEEGGDILIVGNITVDASISYTHPDWANAPYDSEDKRLIPMEDVSGTTDVTLNTSFSLSISVDDNEKPEEFDRFGFTDTDAKFKYVELYPYDPYDH